MEVPRTAALKEAKLRLAADGGATSYHLFDPVSGRSLRLSRRLAQQYHLARNKLDCGQLPSDKSERRALAALASRLDLLRNEAAGLTRKPFNPLFQAVPLFSVSAHQARLKPLANKAFGVTGALLFCALALVCAWMASFSEFKIADSMGKVLSVDGLLAFSVLAPFLKVFHETGHVLAATRHGVRVRQTGLLFVAFYPLPYVDCSEADACGSRRARIEISLAGILTDLLIGMVAFIAWHFTSEDWSKQLLSNIFIFCTLTTLVFNLNPLLKLDGYFAAADFLHRRNAYTRSSRALRDLGQALLAGKAQHAWRQLLTHPWKLAYGTASLIYRLYILTFIAWMLLPQYLGAGAIAVIWGGAVLFLSPWFRASNRPQSDPADGGSSQPTAASYRRWVAPFALFAVAALVPLPHRVTIPVALDTQGVYAVRTNQEGRLSHLHPGGTTDAGTRLYQLTNDGLEARKQVAVLERTMASLAHESASGQNPLHLEGAHQRLAAADAAVIEIARQQSELQGTAPTPGDFFPQSMLRPGAWLAVGDAIGWFLPHVQTSEVTGQFPEIYADRFQESLKGLEFRAGNTHLDSHSATISARLASADGVNSAGLRQFQIKAQIPISPSSLSAQVLHLKVFLGFEPVWRHLLFHYERLRMAFLQSRAFSSAN